MKQRDEGLEVDRGEVTAKSWRARAIGVLVGALSLLTVGFFVCAPAAHADAQGCSGDTCIFLSGNAGGSIVVQAWAYDSSIEGTFTVTGPGGWTYGSPDQEWLANKGNFMSWSENSAPGGQYCVTGTDDSAGYEGTACETLS